MKTKATKAKPKAVVIKSEVIGAIVLFSLCYGLLWLFYR
jgi:hypothetical protein